MRVASFEVVAALQVEVLGVRLVRGHTPEEGRHPRVRASQKPLGISGEVVALALAEEQLGRPLWHGPERADELRSLEREDGEGVAKVGDPNPVGHVLFNADDVSLHLRLRARPARAQLALERTRVHFQHVRCELRVLGLDRVRESSAQTHRAGHAGERHELRVRDARASVLRVVPRRAAARLDQLEQ